MKRDSIRKITVVALFAALSSVLMFLSFNIPIVPSYLKIDFSDLPALLASFSLGPLYGVVVSLIKNLINVTFTTTGGVGELSNFLLSATFVFVAGLIYKKNRNKKFAYIGAVCGLLAATFVSYFTNTYLVYPFYEKVMPINVIIGMSSAIIPSVDSVSDVILIFNVPFTFFKGFLNTVLTFLIYKRVSPIIQSGKIK
ncbi:MAG: ECF transporter S component [Clostridia bacterium]|nr:ECF transporter S component [Clostridia bacterium]